MNPPNNFCIYKEKILRIVVYPLQTKDFVDGLSETVKKELISIGYYRDLPQKRNYLNEGSLSIKYHGERPKYTGNLVHGYEENTGPLVMAHYRHVSFNLRSLSKEQGHYFARILRYKAFPYINEWFEGMLKNEVLNGTLQQLHLSYHRQSKDYAKNTVKVYDYKNGQRLKPIATLTY